MTNSNDQRFTEGSKQDEDLKRNPGIGQSSGAFARGGRLEDAEGDNTVEGDVENEPGGPQGINPDKLGRTNP